MSFVQDVLNILSNARYISSIDLRRVFWQILLDEESTSETASLSLEEDYKFSVLPFGLKNASKTLQQVMNSIFGPEL